MVLTPVVVVDRVSAYYFLPLLLVHVAHGDTEIHPLLYLTRYILASMHQLPQVWTDRLLGRSYMYVVAMMIQRALTAVTGLVRKSLMTFPLFALQLRSRFSLSRPSPYS
ncbi:hypothetical protein F5Y05DRAFT_34526 [Hypoxylon sp. FL0543]|nr:hypothetical protein F5Y05DRAFT_34526 [Hypoxylon sp. FL0543]